MLNAEPLLRATEDGLYCAAGDFFIDPWRPVERAVITHAHADHARWGCQRYLASRDGQGLLKARLGNEAMIDAVSYGEKILLNGVSLSLHPAGHVLGSAQVRLEYEGEVWVASGDYKVESDTTCAPFEPVPCHVFISESTFGLPIYRWPSQSQVFEEINAWWRLNQRLRKASILFAYSLGKSQRVLAGVDHEIGPIFTHGAVEKMNRVYRESGITLPKTSYVSDTTKGTDWSQALIVAPPSAHGSPWVRRFGPASTGFVSGWMRIRGARRRRSVDRGFVLSDHADWPGLLNAIDATGAEQIWLTHGYSAIVARKLVESGRDARILATRYEGESDDSAEPESDSPSGSDNEPASPTAE